jgi:hypothetical protein
MLMALKSVSLVRFHELPSMNGRFYISARTSRHHKFTSMVSVSLSRGTVLIEVVYNDAMVWAPTSGPIDWVVLKSWWAKRLQY